jgi:hypothetical protein
MLAERLSKRIGWQERGVVEIKRSQYFDAGKTSGAVVFFENIYSEND